MTRLVVSAVLVVTLLDAAPADAECSTSLIEATTDAITWCGPADEYLAPFKRASNTAWTPAPTIPAAAWTPLPTPEGDPETLCWTADFSASSGDTVAVDSCDTDPTNTPGPTPTFTPIPSVSADRGLIPSNAVLKQVDRLLLDDSAVPMIDHPGDAGSVCVNWIEVGSYGATVVSLVSASMTIYIPFSDKGYVFNEWGARCFPPGEIVSLDQSAESNAVRANVSYFVK